MRHTVHRSCVGQPGRPEPARGGLACPLARKLAARCTRIVLDLLAGPHEAPARDRCPSDDIRP